MQRVKKLWEVKVDHVRQSCTNELHLFNRHLNISRITYEAGHSSPLDFCNKIGSVISNTAQISLALQKTLTQLLQTMVLWIDRGR